MLGLGIFLSWLFLVDTTVAIPEEVDAAASIPIEDAFTIVAAENDKVRKLWTSQIVGAGKKMGIHFDEAWREPDVAAGPLPALFLREISTYLDQHEVPLSLFLGSEYPITAANAFGGQQQEIFQLIKETHEPQFFYANDTGHHLAMFEDVAVSEACVTCHNDHEQSPKTDWKLGDVMGATTWMYPDGEISPQELMQMISAFREGVASAYGEFMAEVETFSQPPEIGDRWPAEGYFLPSTKVFMRKVEETVSADTLSAVLEVTAAANDPLVTAFANAAQGE